MNKKFQWGFQLVKDMNKNVIYTHDCLPPIISGVIKHQDREQVSASTDCEYLQAISEIWEEGIEDE